MSSASSELTAASVIANLEAGTYPPDVVMTLARGFLPLAQEDLIAVLAWLSVGPDAQVAEVAQASLMDIPARSIHAFATNEEANPRHLELLTRASRDPHVLEALIRNRTVSDEIILDLARRAEPAVQEVIVINQARILREPRILDALLENPQLGPEARRRALETREEFFEKKARLQQIQEILGEEEKIDDSLSLAPIADLLEKAVEEEASGVGLPNPDATGEISTAAIESEKGKSIWSLVLKMTVSEKVQLAFKGDKTVRMILIRERNRLVSSSTIRNPRMTENEVETIAGMRNVEEEVLRIIGNRRDWTSKYPIAIALVKNPKAPIGVVLPLINRLTLRDLKSLKDDRGVAEAVRVNARKLYLARQK